MKKYYVNSDASTNPNHDHEVHCEGCFYMPGPGKRIDLGWFNSAVEAVRAARLCFRNADGCASCCPEAHHR